MNAKGMRPIGCIMGLLAIAWPVAPGAAAPPAGYYNTVDATDSTTLRSTLHDVIDDHTRFPYTAASTDTWDILELADQDPNNANNILDVYKNASYPKQGGGNSFYQREHTWPSSYGFTNDNSSNMPYSDCHMLHLSDGGYNSARSNRPYDTCSAACSEQPTDVNNGQGGGTGAYPGNSNWGSGSGPSTGIWETWVGKRGDVARAMFYMDIRYEGGTHGVTGVSEPDLILTDNRSLIVSNTQNNLSVAHMGMLSVLLQWHAEDPVDADEQLRNDVVFSFQGNRNPFVDHPEWAECLFNNVCGGGGCTISADCDDGLFCNGAETCVAGACQAGSDPCPGQSCDEATDSCFTPSATDPWINEFHYDNVSSDTGEFVEIAGPAGLDLSGWQLIGYNGNGGSSYKTVNLVGVIPDQQGCMGTLSFAFTSLQNGSPDGIALVDDLGFVVEFISYEGSFTAVGGPANGIVSVDVGVVESNSTTQVGESLQLTGVGLQSADFFWNAPFTESPGLPNVGQTLDGCTGCASDAECDDGLFCNGAESCDLPSGNCLAGTPPNCDDGVGCTDDTCNETTDSCDNVANDGNCDNGLFCDGAETCDPAFDCQGGAAVNCDDGMGCTDDSCNEVSDSCDNVANDANCDNGLFCDGAETCSATLDCQAGSDPCPGQNCDEASDMCIDCVIDADCDDGLFCNGAETCVNGTCQPGTAVNCDDGVGCTDDSCNEATDSCDNVANDGNCDNGLFCDGAETCSATLDCQLGAPVNCDDGVGCTDDSCNEATDSCDNVANDGNCGNGLFCDGIETCDPALDCQAGSAVNCDDGVGCTNDACNETTDSCDNVADDLNCDDGLFCNGVETCDPAADCQAGSDPCVGQSCDEAADVCIALTGQPWINELHYDNISTDVGEFVEIAGPAGLDLTGWQLQGYNGATGATYGTTLNLTGVIPDQGGCMGALAFSFPSMQNGSPDGLALIDDLGAVVEFISYEGSFVAVGGPAGGLTSVDIGVAESNSTTPAGNSLQLAGIGAQSADFTWQPDGPETPGLPNTGQTFADCGCSIDADCDDGLFCNGAETCVGGTCQPGTAVNCDDGVGCTNDACNEASDSCDNVANDGNCDNGLFCDGAETCDAFLDCQTGAPVNCDDGVGCTDDTCNEATDSCDNVANDGNCDNGLFCDGAETCDPAFDCQAGAAVNCDDGVGCTDDSCNEVSDSCDNVANDANCDNGLFCDGAETCSATLDCQAGGDPCPGQNCDEASDMCIDCVIDADCDDGLFCNGAETCVGGTCQPGTAVNCDDGVGCTDDSCNEATDSCDNVANDGNCDNGLFCDGAETCSATLDCQAGGDPCPGQSCDEVNDQCVGGGPVAQMEAGVVLAGGVAVTVPLAHTYVSPVVVCSIQYDNNTTPVVTRVSNVTANSFDVRVQNPSDGAVAVESISYIVVEEGVWTIDGVNIEAHTYLSTVTDRKGSWVGQSQSYGQSYTSPVVIGQVMSDNDPLWSFFWCRGGSRTSPPSSTTLFTGKGVAEDNLTTRADETVGFIVIEAGHSVIGGVAFEAALGGDSVRGVGNNPPYSYSFNSPFASAPAVAITSMAAMDGNDGGWAQGHGSTLASSTSLFLSIDEDQIGGSERRHTTEQVGYVVFETAMTSP